MKQEHDLQHAHPRQRRLGTPGRRVSYPESENIVYHNEASMANSTIMCQWLKIIFGEIDTTRDSLLVLDSFRGHLTSYVKETCNRFKITRAVIPGGFTSKLQPLDISVNRSFKSHVKTMMRSNMSQMSHGTEATVYKRNLSKIAKVVRAAWHRVTPETIRNGFRKMMHST